MDKFMVTLGTGTGMGQIQQCCTQTATINGKPIATVGAIASHPYGSDVVIEGIPTILLNGQPIAFSTGKTALGGTLLPNTSVKIGAPESYTGFICSPKVDTEGQRPEGKPVKSEDIKLESDFAWRQIQWQAQNEGEILFQINMVLIFGEDVSVKALARLYKEAKEGTIDNPPIVVCRNRIHGTLQAGYDNDTHSIYVAEELIRQAMHDNEERHKLLAALVEEYGHHIDYLLRSVYDSNKNKDAKGDEGARYAFRSHYQIANIGWQEEAAASFAIATTPEGTTELKWNYEELYSILQEYTEPRQNGTDDHFGSVEGFYVEDLEKKGGFGHFNIQKKALEQLEDTSFEPYREFLERGNWLRDYSQLIAPFVFKVADNVDSSLANQIASSPSASTDSQSNKPLHSVLPFEQLKKRLEDVVRIIALYKCAPENNVNVISRKDYTNWRDVVGGDNGLIPGFDEELGVSVCYEHCDNPKGLEDYSTYHGINDNFNGEILPEANYICKAFGTKNYLRRQHEAEDEAYGARHIVYEYLNGKLDKISQDWWKSGGTSEVQRRKAMVAFGGALHTLQDYFAHSNYVEIYMNKIITSNVITWTNADLIKTYKRKYVTNPPIPSVVSPAFDKRTIDKLITPPADLNQRYSGIEGQRYKLPKLELDDLNDKIYAEREKYFFGPRPSDFRWVNAKAFYAPVTSGTFDKYDLMVSFMHLLQSMLFDNYFKGDPTEPAELEAGQLTVQDIAVLGVLETFGEVAGKTGGLTTFPISVFNTYLAARDGYVGKYIFGHSAKDIVGWVPKVASKVFNVIPGVSYVRGSIALFQEAARCLLIYFLVKVFTEILFSFIPIITASLKDSIKLFRKTAQLDFKGRSADEVAILIYGVLPHPLVVDGEYYHSPFARFMNGSDPSHTMLAKDDPNHPVNDLAGNLAIEATKKAMQQLNKRKKMSIDYLINHPLHTDTYDGFVHSWGRDEANFERILRASLTVTFFENIMVNIVLLTNHRDVLNEILGKSSFFFHSINRIINQFSDGTTQLEQEFVDRLNKDAKSLNELMKEAMQAYKESAFYYLDSLTFLSVSQLFFDLYPEIWKKNEEYYKFRTAFLNKESNEAICEIWRTELDNNLEIYKKKLLAGDLKAKLKVPDLKTIINTKAFDLILNQDKPWKYPTKYE